MDPNSRLKGLSLEPLDQDMTPLVDDMSSDLSRRLRGWSFPTTSGVCSAPISSPGRASERPHGIWDLLPLSSVVLRRSVPAPPPFGDPVRHLRGVHHKRTGSHTHTSDGSRRLYRFFMPCSRLQGKADPDVVYGAGALYRCRRRASMKCCGRGSSRLCWPLRSDGR